MDANRRTFLRRTITAGSLTTTLLFEVEDLFGQADCTLPKPPAATRFIPNEPKIVDRISAADLNDASRKTQLANFRGAFGKIQALPQSDVIGWTKQIAQHCINCARTDANNIHYNWQFVTWHRALLYFLERILRKLPGSPGGDDLRLAYWDWENKASRVLPTIYGPAGQPLFWKNRGTLGAPNWPLTEDDVDVQPSLAIPSFATFGGTATQGKPTPAAFTGPHATVHNNFAPGDMADLQFSPRDPVFYAHHANIDRLWSSWVAAGHANPDFGQAKVFFYDETRTWRFILMNDLKDETKLGYRYSTLMKPSVSPAHFKAITMNKTNDNLFAMETPSLAAVRTKAAEPHFLIIQNIQNLATLPADVVSYGIFSGSPATGTPATAANGYLGKASRVMSSGHDHQAPLSVALNVTGKLSSLLTGTVGSLKLQVVPLNSERKTTGPGIPLVADNVSLVG